MMEHSQQERSARVIAVASGKGGVGKTSISVNLSIALARMGKQAMLLDGDFGLANANILLGLRSTATIADVLARNCTIADVVQQGPAGMQLVPGQSGGSPTAGLDAFDRSYLARCFRPYAEQVDHLLVDTASGISPEGVSLIAASDVILLVLSSEPAAFIDAYQLVKLLSLEHRRHDFLVVCNMVDDAAMGRRLFERFETVVKRFLPTRLDYAGSIPRDDHVRQAVFSRRCCLEAFPDSRASIAFGRLAKVLSGQPLPITQGGQHFFGMEALHYAC